MTSFSWPGGKRIALSLSFDDARPSQLDCGLPILDEHGVKASFYVSLEPFNQRLDDWRAAAENGHEIGNHTVSHPCSANYGSPIGGALEDFTIERMDGEMRQANAQIEKAIGLVPRTFAYPCGQKYVGRGAGLQSYVPLAAKHFLAARGFCDERPNDARRCDLAQLCGMDADTDSFALLKTYLDYAYNSGGWLILAAHEVGPANYQTVEENTLAELCRFATDESNGVWIGTVAEIAGYLAAQRENSEFLTIDKHG